MNADERAKACSVEIQVLGPRKPNGTRDTIHGAGQLLPTKAKAMKAFARALEALYKVARSR